MGVVIEGIGIPRLGGGVGATKPRPLRMTGGRRVAETAVRHIAQGCNPVAQPSKSPHQGAAKCSGIAQTGHGGEGRHGGLSLC